MAISLMVTTFGIAAFLMVIRMLVVAGNADSIARYRKAQAKSARKARQLAGIKKANRASRFAPKFDSAY